MRSGWRFYRFNDTGRQDAREQVEADRHASRIRKERGRQAKAEPDQETRRAHQRLPSTHSQVYD